MPPFCSSDTIRTIGKSTSGAKALNFVELSGPIYSRALIQNLSRDFPKTRVDEGIFEPINYGKDEFSLYLSKSAARLKPCPSSGFLSFLKTLLPDHRHIVAAVVGDINQ